MQKIIIFLFLLIFNCNVFADSSSDVVWTEVEWNHSKDNLKSYVDRKSIVKPIPSDQKIVGMWSLIDFQLTVDNKTENYSAKTSNEFDCEKRLVRSEYYVLYSDRMGTGTVLHSSNRISAWEVPSTKNNDLNLLIVACDAFL